MREDYGLLPRKGKKGTTWYFWYWDGQKRQRRSTGTANKRKADQEARKFLNALDENRITLTFRAYAEPFFQWDTCPHTLRRREEGKSIGRTHVEKSRAWLDRWVMTDPIANQLLVDITRGDILDFRRRLVTRLGSRINTTNKVMSTLKTV